MSLPYWIPSCSTVHLHGSGGAAWSLDDLDAVVRHLAEGLAAHAPGARAIGVYGDNAPAWIAIDLAVQANGAALVPLPGFFTRDQLAHVAAATALEAIFCTDPELADALGYAKCALRIGAFRLHVRRAVRRGPPWSRSEGIAKVTFTSGTTGAPKGVCLTREQQLAAARAVAAATAGLDLRRHLDLLPLSVLLENVAGVYAALLLGASCATPSLAETGLDGSSRFDAERCLDTIAAYAPHSTIVLPQMLAALVEALDRGDGRDPRIASLRFVAVGGAPTPASLILRARDLGLPVHEGYGLTECASVVCLNVPGADRPGTVGRPLPGARVRISDDGEVEVAGRSHARYLGEAAPLARTWLRTGDLGHVDADGFLSIAGRRSNVLITAYGRNVSPEWPEGLLAANAPVAQAAVLGHGRPHLCAILVPGALGVPDERLRQAVAQVNDRLPDYARIGAWMRAVEPFTAANGLATANGRLRRDAIAARYAAQIDRLYATGVQPT